MKKIKKQKLKLQVCDLVIVIVMIIAAIIVIKMKNSDAGKSTTVTKSSLEKVLEISDLSTLDYNYNSIVDVKDEEGEKEKYHVAYEGTVTVGVDMSKVQISVDENIKKITIKVPDPVVQNVNIDMGTLQFIFEKDKYETESVTIEAYNACVADLENKAKQEDSLMTIAKENAINGINALISPWIEQVEGKYTVEVK